MWFFLNGNIKILFYSDLKFNFYSYDTKVKMLEAVDQDSDTVGF